MVKQVAPAIPGLKKEGVGLSRYDDVSAKCPFYQRSSEKNIVCEGIIENSVSVQEFNKKSDREAYRNRYCNNQYSKCRLYDILEKKYK